MQSNFDRLLEKEMAANNDAMFRVPLGDACQHAMIKGVRVGLETARRLYREAVRRDVDPEGDA